MGSSGASPTSTGTIGGVDMATQAELNALSAATVPGFAGGFGSHPTLSEVGSLTVGSSAGSMLVEGRYLYACMFNDDKIWTIDLNDRDNAAKASELAVGDGPTWLAKRGKYLFVFSSNDGVVKVVNTATNAVSQTLTLSVGAGGQRMGFNGRYLCIGGPESGGSANKITIVDTINPTTIVEKGTLAVGTVHRGIVPLDATHFALCSRDTDVLYIIDITNPSIPHVSGSLSGLSTTLTPAAVDPLFNQGRPYVYVASYNEGTLYIVDCQDFANPKLAGQVTTTANTEQVIPLGGRYVAMFTRTTHSAVVVDVQDVAKPEATSTLTLTAARADRACYSNGRLYFMDLDNAKMWTLKIEGGKAAEAPPQVSPTRLAPQPLFASMTGNQTLTQSNTTPQNLTELVVAVEPFSVYEVEILLMYEATTVADLKFTFATLTGATLSWAPFGPTASAGNNTNAGLNVQSRAITDTATVGGGGAGTSMAARVRGLLRVGSTAGNLQAKASQQNSEATDVIVYADSFMRLQKLA